MSLDVYLIDKNGNRVYDANITHNLNKMAEEAGIYMQLWRPEECGITHANQIIESLKAGLFLLVSEKSRFEKFNSPNGWGTYRDFVLFCINYLQACVNNPDAEVYVSR